MTAFIEQDLLKEELHSQPQHWGILIKYYNMSTTYTSIPVKQISTNFGTVNKVIWFDVTGITGTFGVNLFITPNQSTDINIVIFNKGSNEELYRKTYNKSSDSSVIIDTVKLRHVPGQKSETYGIKSL